jgi:heavy metal translocating P-type ATPase
MSCGCGENPSGGALVPGDMPAMWRIALAIVLSGQSMLISLTVNTSAMQPNERRFFQVFLTALVIATFELVGRPLWVGVREALRARASRFELLFATAIAGALGLSLVSILRGRGDVYFDVAAILVTLYAVGYRVNGVERQKGFAALRELRLQDQECTLRTCCGSTKTVPVAQVKPGQLTIVHPGERVGLDGIVEKHRAFVQEALITGEPLEAIKGPGEPIHAGSVVVDATLHVRVTAGVGERMLDRVAAAVEAAWARPSRIERLADRATRWLLPSVVIVAVTVQLGWGLARGFEVGVFHAMAVLLVACPCAMGFAIPLTLAGSLGGLGKRGVFLRGGDALERLAQIDLVVFDKTGTLTEPEARLVDSAFAVDTPYDRPCLRELLSTVERASHHPVARAFCDMAPAGERFVVDSLRTLHAKGIEAEVIERANGARIRVALGTTALVPREDTERLAQLALEVATPADTQRLVAIIDGRLAAVTSVREQPRLGAHELVRTLERLGLEVMLLTGDRSGERSALFGASAVESGLTPTEKAARVRELAASGRKVLFVGDGINDGAAMVLSHAALAPDDGTRLAQDVAHGVFRGASIIHLGWVIAASRRSIAALRANLHYAIVYNGVGVTVAACGLLDPVFAALLMVCSSLFVTFRASGLVSRLAAEARDGSGPARSDGRGVVAIAHPVGSQER